MPGQDTTLAVEVDRSSRPKCNSQSVRASASESTVDVSASAHESCDGDPIRPPPPRLTAPSGVKDQGKCQLGAQPVEMHGHDIESYFSASKAPKSLPK